MRKIITSKFIEKEGYWFNIEKIADGDYIIFNTQRRKNQSDRDGIGYVIEYFENLKEAKEYLENIQKIG